MTRRLRIRAVERKEIDLDKLALALLRLAEERLAASEPTPPAAKPAEPDHD